MSEQQQVKPRVKRGDNKGDVKAATRIALAEDEMNALDLFGPMMRRLLTDGPVKVSAISLIEDIDKLNAQIDVENDRRRPLGLPQRRRIDPQDPECDRFLTIGSANDTMRILSEDRAPEDVMAGLKPLQPKPSAHTARERRKTEGRRFRGW